MPEKSKRYEVSSIKLIQLRNWTVKTDLNMPEITGIEFIGKAREIYPDQSLPIIMVTAQNEIQDNERARKAGVSDISFKPFTAESLKQGLDGVSQAGRSST